MKSSWHHGFCYRFLQWKHIPPGSSGTWTTRLKGHPPARRFHSKASSASALRRAPRGGAPRGAAWRLGMKNAGRCWEMRKIMGILLMILLLISGYSTRKTLEFAMILPWRRDLIKSTNAGAAGEFSPNVSQECGQVHKTNWARYWGCIIWSTFHKIIFKKTWGRGICWIWIGCSQLLRDAMYILGGNWVTYTLGKL